jgi:hypothetical protein
VILHENHSNAHAALKPPAPQLKAARCFSSNRLRKRVTMKNLLVAFTAVIVVSLLSPPLFGQYTMTAWFNIVDNTPWCNGTSFQCLTSIGGVMTEIKAGADGTIYGLNSSHVLYTYTHAAGWVQAAAALQSPGGGSIVHISVGGKSQVMALSNILVGANVYVLNGAGTGWTALGAKRLSASAAEIGSDGTVWGMNSSGLGWAYVNGAWAARGGGLSNIAVASAWNAWGVTSAGTLEQWNGSLFVALSPAPPFSPSHAKNAIATVSETSLAALDTTGIIHISTDSGNTWSTIAGTASSITGGAPTMFVLNSSGVSYHINLTVPALSIQESGSYTCPQPEGCPPGSYHTVSANAFFGGVGGAHGPAGVTAQSSGYPLNYIGAVAFEPASQCDFLFGNLDDPPCQPHQNSVASCSMMGYLSGGGGLVNYQIEPAFTQAYWNGAPAPSCSENGACVYQVHNNCTAGTTPPDMGMGTVISGNFVGDTYVSWMNGGVCIGLSTRGPWFCKTLISWINAVNVPLLPYACTHNQ